VRHREAAERTLLTAIAAVAGIYQRAKYSDEMRTALQRLADHLDQITA
jgi:plasmid stabilization system protein ParE